MLSKKYFNEYKQGGDLDEIIVEGYVYHLELEGETVEEFAKTILTLVNQKSSNFSDTGIVEVKTFYGSNTIEVVSVVNIERYLSQFVKEKKDLTMSERIKVVIADYYEISDFLKSNNYISEEDDFTMLMKA